MLFHQLGLEGAVAVAWHLHCDVALLRAQRFLAEFWRRACLRASSCKFRFACPTFDKRALSALAHRPAPADKTFPPLVFVEPVWSDTETFQVISESRLHLQSLNRGLRF